MNIYVLIMLVILQELTHDPHKKKRVVIRQTKSIISPLNIFIHSQKFEDVVAPFVIKLGYCALLPSVLVVRKSFLKLDYPPATLHDEKFLPIFVNRPCYYAMVCHVFDSCLYIRKLRSRKRI